MIYFFAYNGFTVYYDNYYTFNTTTTTTTTTTPPSSNTTTSNSDEERIKAEKENRRRWTIQGSGPHVKRIRRSNVQRTSFQITLPYDRLLNLKWTEDTFLQFRIEDNSKMVLTVKPVAPFEKETPRQNNDQIVSTHTLENQDARHRKKSSIH